MMGILHVCRSSQLTRSGPSTAYHEDLQMGSPWDWDLLSALVHAIIPLRSDWYVNHTSSKAKDIVTYRSRQCRRPLWRANHRSPRLRLRLPGLRPPQPDNNQYDPRPSPAVHLPVLRRSRQCPADGGAHGRRPPHRLESRDAASRRFRASGRHGPGIRPVQRCLVMRADARPSGCRLPG